MNSQIITQFEKLIDQIKSEIDISPTKEVSLKNNFRLSRVTDALKIIKKYPKVITNGEDLGSIKGIGKGTIDRINEILRTGKLSEIKMDKMKSKYLKSVEELETVFGIGRSTAYDLVVNKGISSVEELKDAVKKGKIDVSDQIMMGLKYHGVFLENIPRVEMDMINSYLVGIGHDLELKIVLCGSYRRGKVTSNDIDVLLSHNDELMLHNFIKVLKKDKFIIDDLTHLNYKQKYMGFCKYLDHPVRRIDIRIVNPKSFYTAMLYFTGSGEFNVKMRELAGHLGYLLNEYGLYKLSGEKKVLINVKSERDIFDVLGMEYLEPNERN